MVYFSDRRHLLLFPGGMDSTYLLYYYLTQTNLPIHAHYISMSHPRIYRWQLEDLAVKNIIEYCNQQYRAVSHSQSMVEIGD